MSASSSSSWTATAGLRSGTSGRARPLRVADPAGALRERRGQHVLIRYMPYDDREIHVYLDGEFLATCYPRDALSAEQEEAFYAAARAQEKQAAAERTAARRRGRRRLAALSAGQDTADPVRRVPAEALLADRAQDRAAQERLRAASSTSLLGLGPVGPIEVVDLARLDVPQEGRPW